MLHGDNCRDIVVVLYYARQLIKQVVDRGVFGSPGIYFKLRHIVCLMLIRSAKHRLMTKQIS